MILRRRFLSETAQLAALTAGGALSRHIPAQEKLPTNVEPIQVISHEPEYYHGWGTIARDAKGTLYVAASGGRDAHVCPFGRVILMRSHDEGRTWNWPETLMDTAIDDRDSGICVTRSGALLVTTFTSLAYEGSIEKHRADWPAERLERWLLAHNRLDAVQRKSLLGTWMLRSTDGGLTWSAPYRVPLNSPHGPIALRDGRLLYAGKELWSEDKPVGISFSNDDGVTWTPLQPLPVRSGDLVLKYHELHAVEAPSGKLIVQIRNANRNNEGETLQSESSDGGKTWTTPHSIGVWGLPSHLLRLRSGRLLMVYGYRRPPFGNQARWSDDEGATWSAPLTVSGDGASGDLGYPSTVELPDASLYTVWYEKLASSPKAVLRAVRWRLPA